MEAAAPHVAQTNDAIFIESKEPRDPALQLRVIHFSCASDPFQKGHNYAGFILYSHNGETDWYLNGRHCKTGYLVIQDTSKHEGVADGDLHGAVYMNMFGENIGDTVGEVFLYVDGIFKWQSHSFNTQYSSSYHNSDKEMAEVTKKCVSRILEEWKACEGYLPTCRNFEIKEFL